MSPSSPVMLAAALAVTALLVIGATAWRRSFVMALPFLAILDGLAIPFAGASLRVDQLAATLLVVPLGAAILSGARRPVVDRTTWLIAAILGMNVLASAINSPALGYSLRQCANLASAWVIYVVLINFLDTREEVDTFFRCVLWAAILESCIGTGAYVLAVMGLPIGGAEVSAGAAEELTKAYGAYGTMLEPNILGSFTAAHLVLALVLLAVAAQHPATANSSTRSALRWVAVSTAIALVLSFTRAAWLGAVVGVVWFAAFGARTVGMQARPWRILAPLGIGVGVAVVLVLLPGSGGDFLRFKLFNVLNLESKSVVWRVLGYTLGLQQTAVHPVIGWGTFTFAPLVAQGTDFQQFENWRNLWISNFLLLALHDTGIIGLALWCALIWSVLSSALRSIRALVAYDFGVATRALALTAAVIALLVPFLATNGFTLGYPWLLLGLLAAHGRLALTATTVGSGELVDRSFDDADRVPQGAGT